MQCFLEDPVEALEDLCEQSADYQEFLGEVSSQEQAFAERQVSEAGWLAAGVVVALFDPVVLDLH